MRYFLVLLLCYRPIFYEDRVQAVYDSLDSTSLKELFAFYTLYKETKTAEGAFDKAWNLINLHRPLPLEEYRNFTLPLVSLEAIIALTTTGSTSYSPNLSLSELKIIDRLGEFLGNRSLKGHLITSTNQTLELDAQEVDVARSILLHEFDFSNEEEKKKLLLYEASLDLMALQILAKLPKNPTYEQKLDAINHFIFHEMGYRFPPQSMWNNDQDLDIYTFLPSVMDSRHGVCLGVSILYMCLAQRIYLPLEIITPPGHIYLSFTQSDEVINIETTARGIHLPEEHYLTVNTKSLPRRTLKELVGMHFFNHAARSWQSKNYERAKELYLTAKDYIPTDPLIDTFLGFQHLFLGEKEKALKLFDRVKHSPDMHTIHQHTIVEDYLNGEVDEEGIKIAFSHVDERRESILEKQEQLQKILERYPKFRDGIFHLAITWLQLGRTKEALDTLSRYHEIDLYDPIVEYYLCILSIKRLQYHKAWQHYFILDKILSSSNHKIDAVEDLHDSLLQIYPYHL
ncbi:MAG: hypothetical protein FJZ56_03120 [Chlamydiae bacterium]|nr:hypothetical protein [Chlamydiota bacterium]